MRIFILFLLVFNNVLLAQVIDNEEIKLRNDEVFKNKIPKGQPVFFPTEFDNDTNKTMLVLPFVCARDQTVEWDSRYESFISGLKPGSNINAYSKDGVFVDGLLGSAQCFIGECTANYVSLPIEVDTKLDEIVVVSKAMSITTSNVEISSPVNCENVPLKKNNPYGFDFEALPTTCNEILEPTNNTDVLGQLVSFGWGQENGWNVYEQFFRSVNVGLDGETTFGELTYITYSTSKEYPLFQFTKNKGIKSLLWYDRSGIGPVSKFTLKESVNDKTENIKWLTEYNAGGQPCD